MQRRPPVPFALPKTFQGHVPLIGEHLASVEVPIPFFMALITADGTIAFQCVKGLPQGAQYKRGSVTPDGKIQLVFSHPSFDAPDAAGRVRMLEINYAAIPMNEYVAAAANVAIQIQQAQQQAEAQAQADAIRQQEQETANAAESEPAEEPQQYDEHPEPEAEEAPETIHAGEAEGLVAPEGVLMPEGEAPPIEPAQVVQPRAARVRLVEDL